MTANEKLIALAYAARVLSCLTDANRATLACISAIGLDAVASVDLPETIVDLIEQAGKHASDLQAAMQETPKGEQLIEFRPADGDVA